jgi:quercetin dioxygenase-like cupin family protein
MRNSETKEFLDGRVRVVTLPELTPPLRPDAPALKRLQLAQGELAQVCEGTEGMRYIALIEMKPGCARGNHYHKSKLEHAYVITGEVLLALRDISTGESAEVLLRAGSLARIAPMVGHVFIPDSAGWAIEFSPQAFDPADLFPFSART